MTDTGELIFLGAVIGAVVWELIRQLSVKYVIVNADGIKIPAKLHKTSELNVFGERAKIAHVTLMYRTIIRESDIVGKSGRGFYYEE